MPYNPDVHHRHSIRLQGYDYAGAGVYFVTLCAFRRECLFGEVMDGEMRLNSCGEIVREEWDATAVMRQNVTVDAYVIMPNHFHAVIFMQEPAGARSERDQVRRKSGSIGSIIAGFKAAVTRRVNALHDNAGCSVWQRNYYEHIIRSDVELAAIREYIRDNPAKWSDDEENPEEGRRS